MDTDDLEPPKKKPEVKDLEIMSVEALGEYIAELEAEIKRTRTAISLKKSALGSAEDAFR